MLRVVILVVGALLSPTAVMAQERLDAAGDPLPPGAILRLGTTRWRNDNGIAGIACTPDGKWLLGLCYEQLTVWDTSDGKRLRTIPHTPDPATPQRLALAPDGRQVALHDKGAVVLRALPDGEVRHILKVAENSHDGLIFSPDGATLVTDTFKKVYLWDTATGKLRAEIPWSEKEGRVHCAAFSHDGKWLYLSAENFPLRRIDVTAERPEATIWLNGERGRSLALSPDGKTLAACVAPPPKGNQSPHSLLLIDPESGKIRQKIAGPKDGIFTNLSFTKGGQALVFAASPHLLVYELDSGKIHRHVEKAGRFSSRMAVAPDGKTLYTNFGHCIRRWRLPALDEIEPVEEISDAWKIRIAPHGSQLFVGYYGGPLRLWDLKTGTQIRNLPYSLGEGRNVYFTPDGRSVVASYAPGASPRKNQPRGHLAWDVKTGELSEPILPKRIGPFAMTADGRLMACTAQEKKLEVWDLEAKKEIAAIEPMPGLNGSIVPLAFSPDGRQLAYVTFNKGLTLWDFRTGATMTMEDSKGQDPTMHVDFSPDGLLIMGRYYNRQLWDATTGRLISKVSQSGATGTVRFTRDSRGVVIGDGKRLQLYDVVEGRFVRELVTGGSNPSCFDLAADHKTIATGQKDGTVILWDAKEFLKPLPLAVQKLSEKEMNQLWNLLANDDAKAALQARWRLASAEGVAAFLKPRLLSGKAPSEKEVAARIVQLNSDQFIVRDQAMTQLMAWGERVEPALRRALGANPSLEMRRRLDELLERFNALPAGPAAARNLRAVAVLEVAGDTEARALLRMLADGGEGTRLAVAARAALKRN